MTEGPGTSPGGTAADPRQASGTLPAQSISPTMFDAILPAKMAVRAEESGVAKASLDPTALFVLAVLGGAFVSFGAIFATTVTAATIVDGTVSSALTFGVMRLLTGVVFCLGFVLIVIGGAELFTGNNLVVMAWASRKVTTRGLLMNWIIVFIGNLVGAFGTAALLFFSTQYTFGNGAVGLVALNIAQLKGALEFFPALTLAILCNALVCLAAWMCYSARSNIDRVAVIVPPVAAFAAAGFEHCIANLYFFSVGLFIKAGAPASFWTSIKRTADDFPAVTWGHFLANMVPVTIGNIIGGSVMVGAVYWFVYLRRRPV